MPSTGAARYYRLFAGRCVEKAQHLAADSTSKTVLLIMAQAWLALAEQAEKNSETTLVYETPEPRPPVVRQQPLQPKPEK